MTDDFRQPQGGWRLDNPIFGFPAQVTRISPNVWSGAKVALDRDYLVPRDVTGGHASSICACVAKIVEDESPNQIGVPPILWTPGS